MSREEWRRSTEKLGYADAVYSDDGYFILGNGLRGRFMVHRVMNRVVVAWSGCDLLDGGLRVTLSYSKETMPYCSEWKQLGEGDYVMGIEPGTWLPEGRAKARERGELLYLEPGEEYTIDLCFDIQEL